MSSVPSVLRILRHRRAFTLVELLLVMGIIAILASITIAAINPSQQLSKAKDSSRDSDAKQIQQGIAQYMIAVGKLPNDSQIPGAPSAKRICKQGVTTDTTCVNVDAIAPTYVGSVPQDATEGCANYSGYKISKANPQLLVEAAHEGSAGVSTLECGLVGYWRMDEGGGLYAGDAAGGSNSGVYVGAPARTSDVPTMKFVDARSMQVNGGGGYITVAANASQNITDAITVAAWVKLQSVTGANADTGIFMKGNYIYGFTRDTRAGGTTNTNVYAYLQDGGAYLSTSLPSFSVWHHIALTYDRTAAAPQFKFYANGVLVNSRNGTNPIGTSAAPLLIGMNGTQNFNGSIDDVRLYNRALTPTEIASLAGGNN